MTKLAAIALAALLSACSLYVEEAGPDAGVDAEPTECERYCTWEHNLTGVSVEGCVAECEADDCADCCATTPTWPECPPPDLEVCCPELCAEHPEIDTAYCVKACGSNCAVNPETCCVG